MWRALAIPSAFQRRICSCDGPSFGDEIGDFFPSSVCCFPVGMAPLLGSAEIPFPAVTLSDDVLSMGSLEVDTSSVAALGVVAGEVADDVCLLNFCSARSLVWRVFFSTGVSSPTIAATRTCFPTSQIAVMKFSD